MSHLDIASRKTETYLEKFNHPGPKRLNQFILKVMGWFFMKLKYKITVNGINHIPRSGPLLYLIKHQRFSDIPLGYSFVLTKIRRDNWSVMMHSLAKWYFFGFFLKTGGIPLTRHDREKSRKELLLAREVLHEGNALALFPEQKLHPGRMGLGKITGFKIIADKPQKPVQVITTGFKYKSKGIFRRTEVTIELGKPHLYKYTDDAELFLHNRMVEMANLCNLEYTFEHPSERQAGTS